MPNRIIKESVCSSDAIDNLSWMQEVFFYRLIVSCDDFGRMDARLPMLKAKLFPLKSVTESQIGDCLAKLSKEGLVFLYEYDGKPYLQLLSWERHQSIRNKRSKYPPEGVLTIAELVERFSTRDVVKKEPAAKVAVQNEVITEKAIVMLELNTGAEHPIYQKDIDKWSKLYPAVDVLQQLRNMSGWLNANPTKRKTANGVLRFVTAWLAKEQNSGGRAKQVPADAQYEHDSDFIGR